MSQIYTLPDIRTVDGIVHIKITSITEGLTKPTYQTVKSLGKKVDTAQIDTSQTEVPQFTITVLQDLDGFWAGILYVPSEFIITITEADSVERWLFSGAVESETVDWQSDSNIADSRTGTITFTILGEISNLFKYSTQDWITAVDDHCVTLDEPTGVHPWKVISVRGLFATMLHAAGYNAGYDLTLVDFVAGTNKEFIFYDGAGSPVAYDVSQLYVCVKYKNGSNVQVYTTYFLDTEDNYLGKRYGSLKELCGAICRNFGLRIEMYYDLSDSKYKIHILQAMRTYDGYVDFGTNLKEEHQSVDATLICDAIRATFYNDSTHFVWQSAKWSAMAYYVVDPDTISKTGVDFGLDLTTIWHVTNGSGLDGNPERLYGHLSEVTGGSYTQLNNIINVSWRKSQSPDVTVAATDPSSNELKLEQALVGYNGWRMIRGSVNAKPGWFKNTCKYRTIAAVVGGVTSFSNIVLMCKTQHTLGFGSPNKDYYANKITLDLDASEVEVEWIQEE